MKLCWMMALALMALGVMHVARAVNWVGIGALRWGAALTDRVKVWQEYLDREMEKDV